MKRILSTLAALALTASLNYSADVQKMFNKDPQGALKKADAAWPKLVAEHGK